MGMAYPSDLSVVLSDVQWANLEPLIAVERLGRPREFEMREVIKTMLYPSRPGRQWDMLTQFLPPKSTVHDDFEQFREEASWEVVLHALRQKVRADAGRVPSPGAKRITVEVSEVGDMRGYELRGARGSRSCQGDGGGAEFALLGKYGRIAWTTSGSPGRASR